jgi:hypothetical protein
MKKEIVFKINFFGKSIIMTFDKEDLLLNYKEFLFIKNMSAEYHISIRDYIRFRIADAISETTESQQKGFYIGF